MSRVAKMPVTVPAGVEVVIGKEGVSVKGPKGELKMPLHAAVEVVRQENEIRCSLKQGVDGQMMQVGTARALIANMVHGVSEGFVKNLQLVGVGYRAQMQGNILNLSLGYSHQVEYPVPEGVDIETPAQTEILVRGADKQRVGQVAAEIRAWRPPEPYKGKGVRYKDENIVRKEAKKK
ncbi:MAG: 50S ribosomal protein L6 [Ectothiorhodospiraceae bacterium AqS1]|nr:50S ribosomal protein L6 [Ectothiorhodospiraceae bacterium AqS1]